MLFNGSVDILAILSWFMVLVMTSLWSIGNKHALAVGKTPYEKRKTPPEPNPLSLWDI